MNNAVFGKTMEKVRNCSGGVVLNGHETKRLEKLIVKPYYGSSFIFENSD